MPINKDSWDNRTWPQLNVLPYREVEELIGSGENDGWSDPYPMVTPRYPARNSLLSSNWPTRPLFGYDEANIGTISNVGNCTITKSAGTLTQAGGYSWASLSEGKWVYIETEGGNNTGYYLLESVSASSITIDLDECDFYEDESSIDVDITPVDFTKGVVVPVMLFSPLDWSFSFGWADATPEVTAPGGDSGVFFGGNSWMRPGIHLLFCDMSKATNKPTYFTFDITPHKYTGIITGGDWPVAGAISTGDYDELEFDFLQQSAVYI